MSLITKLVPYRAGGSTYFITGNAKLNPEHFSIIYMGDQ